MVNAPFFNVKVVIDSQSPGNVWGNVQGKSPVLRDLWF